MEKKKKIKYSLNHTDVCSTPASDWVMALRRNMSGEEEEEEEEGSFVPGGPSSGLSRAAGGLGNEGRK